MRGQEDSNWAVVLLNRVTNYIDRNGLPVRTLMAGPKISEELSRLIAEKTSRGAESRRTVHINIDADDTAATSRKIYFIDVNDRGFAPGGDLNPNERLHYPKDGPYDDPRDAAFVNALEPQYWMEHAMTDKIRSTIPPYFLAVGETCQEVYSVEKLARDLHTNDRAVAKCMGFKGKKKVRNPLTNLLEVVYEIDLPNDSHDALDRFLTPNSDLYTLVTTPGYATGQNFPNRPITVIYRIHDIAALKLIITRVGRNNNDAKVVIIINTVDDSDRRVLAGLVPWMRENNYSVPDFIAEHEDDLKAEQAECEERERGARVGRAA